MKKLPLCLLFIVGIPAYYGFVSGYAGVYFNKDLFAYTLINLPALLMSFTIYNLLTEKKEIK